MPLSCMKALNLFLTYLGLLQVLLLLLSRGAVGDPTGTQCEPAPGREETCVCKTEGGVIDLTPFSNKDGTARFKNLADNHDQKLSYSYNPCRTFQDADPCDDVFICAYVQDNSNVPIAPALSEEMWIEEDGTPYVFYANTNNDRETKVYLNCDQGVGLEDTVAVADGEIHGRLHYFFNISSCQVCPGGCHTTTTPLAVIPGLIGFAIIAVAICALITYFVVGALINKFYRKASGKDIIPQREFWFHLPILIKDGFAFVFRPCYRPIIVKLRSRQGYKPTN